MRRFSFLQIFLTCLAIGFAVAVALRIRSERSSVDDSRPRLSTSETTTEARVAPDSRARLSSTEAETQSQTQTQSRSAAASERERARQMLLQQPIAAAPPINNAGGARQGAVGTAKTPAAPISSKGPTPPGQRTVPSSAGMSIPSGNRSNVQASTSTAPKDPNSDTAPPQLISIQFDPQTVHDGEEAHVILTAVDDLSGIRGISGTITSPTGKALQGFAGQRDADTNRYIGRVQIPKNGEEGLWRVNVITMSDNASNSVTLSLAQGTLQANAGLQVVSSQSDSTPPTLKSVRAEKRSMRAGEPNPIYVEAVDDQSGVALVSAVFQSPSKRARIGAGCRNTGDGNIWQCDLSLPTCIDCGDWQLEQVTLQDKANNLATFRTDNPIVAAVKINIGGDSCDNEPPRLQSIVIDPPAVSPAREPATITVMIIATDDACGMEGASGQYAGPGTGNGGFFPFQKEDETRWVGRIPIDPHAPRGTWRITSIQLTDKGHNLRIYYGNDPLLANAIFSVR